MLISGYADWYFGIGPLTPEMQQVFDDAGLTAADTADYYGVYWNVPIIEPPAWDTSYGYALELDANAELVPDGNYFATIPRATVLAGADLPDGAYIEEGFLRIDFQ